MQRKFPCETYSFHHFWYSNLYNASHFSFFVQAPRMLKTNKRTKFMKSKHIWSSLCAVVLIFYSYCIKHMCGCKPFQFLFGIEIVSWISSKKLNSPCKPYYQHNNFQFPYSWISLIYNPPKARIHYLNTCSFFNGIYQTNGNI